MSINPDPHMLMQLSDRYCKGTCILNHCYTPRLKIECECCGRRLLLCAEHELLYIADKGHSSIHNNEVKSHDSVWEWAVEQGAKIQAGGVP